MKVLDIAAGHGMYGIKHCEQESKSGSRRAGLAQRAASRPGRTPRNLAWPIATAFAREALLRQRWAQDTTMRLLTNIFHHFDTAGCETLDAAGACGAEAWRESDHAGVRAQ